MHLQAHVLYHPEGKDGSMTEEGNGSARTLEDTEYM